MNIVMEAHICTERRSYKVTFSTEQQAIDFIKARWKTHVVREWEDGCIEWDQFLALYDLLHPLCDHGLSASNCMGPDHWCSPEEIAAGW